jgi:hypothetical protein
LVAVGSAPNASLNIDTSPTIAIASRIVRLRFSDRHDPACSDGETFAQGQVRKQALVADKKMPDCTMKFDSADLLSSRFDVSLCVRLRLALSSTSTKQLLKLERPFLPQALGRFGAFREV